MLFYVFVINKNQFLQPEFQQSTWKKYPIANFG